MNGRNERWPAGRSAKDGDRYRVTEIYETLQGEGHNVGTPVTLVRLAKCNLACSYCDTEFDSFELMGAGEIAARCHVGRAVMVTGGEPLLQLDDELLVALGSRPVFVETSGTVRPRFTRRVSWLVVSPKTLSPSVAPQPIDELRIPITARTRRDSVARLLEVPARHYYLSPVFDDAGALDQGALDSCLTMLAEWPGRLRLSVQTHKLLGLK